MSEVISSGLITPTMITPTDFYNCHGWTFTDNWGWLSDVVTPTLQVERIISDNGYTLISPTNYAYVGSLVVYRSITDSVLHTGIVREVQKEDETKSTTYNDSGVPTLVESKWGGWGQYLHPPDKVTQTYVPSGGSIKYYQPPPGRQNPPNSKDPGRDQHRLKSIK